jgi:hypothetical protein
MMKKPLFTLFILLLLTTSIVAQSVSTNRQIYNFQTGDIFHFEYSYPYYHSVSNSVINQKYYSANQDTVFYVFTLIQESTSSFAPDTIISRTDTIFYTHLDSLVFNGMIDSVYNNSTLYHNRKINEYVFDDTLNLYYYRRMYADSLGEVLYYYMDLNSMDIAERKLVYYKKGNEVWGTPSFVGMKEKSEQTMDLVLFPNPVDNYLEIHSSMAAQLEYTLYDLNGKILKHYSSSTPAKSHIISTEELSLGLYFIRVNSDGMRERILRFVKE